MYATLEEAQEAAFSPLAGQLRVAIRLLKNYAAYDEKIGHDEDADYTRRHLAEMEAALGAQP